MLHSFLPCLFVGSKACRRDLRPEIEREEEEKNQKRKKSQWARSWEEKKQIVRDGSRYQNGGTFGKIPNGLCTPHPNFRKPILQFLSEKPGIKVQNLQYKFLDWKWPASPAPFGTFPKIHPFWYRHLSLRRKKENKKVILYLQKLAKPIALMFCSPSCWTQNQCRSCFVTKSKSIHRTVCLSPIYFI